MKIKWNTTNHSLQSAPRTLCFPGVGAITLSSRVPKILVVEKIDKVHLSSYTLQKYGKLCKTNYIGSSDNVLSAKEMEHTFLPMHI